MDGDVKKLKKHKKEKDAVPVAPAIPASRLAAYHSGHASKPKHTPKHA